MTDIVISDVSRRAVYTGSAGAGPYSFSFELLDQGDIAVYVNDALQTITTDYTVSLNADGTGSITLVSAASASDTVVLLGNKGIARSTDFVTGGDLLAVSLNEELDAQTIFAQQNKEAIDRAIKIPVQSSLSIDTTLPVPQANYILGWNDTGDAILNLQEIGSYQGTDATTTTAAYANRDLVKDSSNSNVYICLQASPAGTALTNTSYWALIVDAAAAASSSSSASGFADEAEEWATKVDGIVESTDYSSKAWSIGGTGVTTTSGKGAAKEWATSTGAAVDTSEYSAKEYAVGDLTATGGSAKAWAIDSSSPDGSSEKSAKTLAGEAATSASNAATSESNAADWAVKTDGIVDSTDYAAKAWSIGGTGVTDTASAGAAKEWATKAEDSTVDGTEYSAKHYAAKAAASASAAATSADNFDDRYLGPKSSDPTLDNDGDALTTGDLYFNTTINRMKVYDGSAWQDAVVDTTNFVGKTSSTGSAELPVGTTAQRDGSPSAGYLRWNSDDTSAEVYDGSAWTAVGGGNSTTEGLYEHAHTISANYSITSGNNAMSAGPITVDTGVSVTVPTGSTWTIV